MMNNTHYYSFKFASDEEKEEKVQSLVKLLLHLFNSITCQMKELIVKIIKEIKYTLKSSKLGT